MNEAAKPGRPLCGIRGLASAGDGEAADNNETITEIEWSPDGRAFATVSNEATALIWPMPLQATPPPLMPPAITAVENPPTIRPGLRFPQVRWTSVFSDLADETQIRRLLDQRIVLEKAVLVKAGKHLRHCIRPRSCTHYLTLTKKGYRVEEPTARLDYIGEGETLLFHCQGLKALQHAVPARRSFVKDLTLTTRVLENLPPLASLGNSIDGEETRHQCLKLGRSWHQCDPAFRLVQSSQTEAVLKDAVVRVSVRIAAWGDFNGDGTEDVMVQVSEAMHRVAEWSYSLAVLTREGAAEPLKVITHWEP